MYDVHVTYDEGSWRAAPTGGERGSSGRTKLCALRLSRAARLHLLPELRDEPAHRHVFFVRPGSGSNLESLSLLRDTTERKRPGDGRARASLRGIETMKVNWTAVIVLSIVALFAFLNGASLIGGFGGFGGYRGWGMMGPGMMGGWGFAPFGWIGMLLMWMFPLGLLILVVLGIVWLVNAVSRPRSQLPVAPAKTCQNCEQPVQADWRNCPYCGAALGG